MNTNIIVVSAPNDNWAFQDESWRDEYDSSWLSSFDDPDQPDYTVHDVDLKNITEDAEELLNIVDGDARIEGLTEEQYEHIRKQYLVHDEMFEAYEFDELTGIEIWDDSSRLYRALRDAEGAAPRLRRIENSKHNPESNGRFVIYTGWRDDNIPLDRGEWDRVELRECEATYRLFLRAGIDYPLEFDRRMRIYHQRDHMADAQRQTVNMIGSEIDAAERRRREIEVEISRLRNESKQLAVTVDQNRVALELAKTKLEERENYAKSWADEQLNLQKNQNRPATA